VALAIIDLPSRLYVELLLHSAIAIVEVKGRYDNLTPRQKEWLFGLSQEVAGNLITTAGGVAIGAGFAAVWAVVG
jgi:hypothetical protein